ncbi:MAG: hypothetical protein WCF04_09325 [Candidatus Nanopelagicales bacterium]
MGGSPVVVEGWVEFDALVEVLPWGRSDYVIIRLAPALAEAAKPAGTRQVDGTIDDVPVNVGVNRAERAGMLRRGEALEPRRGWTSPRLLHELERGVSDNLAGTCQGHVTFQVRES